MLLTEKGVMLNKTDVEEALKHFLNKPAEKEYLIPFFKNESIGKEALELAEFIEKKYSGNWNKICSMVEKPLYDALWIVRRKNEAIEQAGLTKNTGGSITD